METLWIDTMRIPKLNSYYKSVNYKNHISICFVPIEEPLIGKRRTNECHIVGLGTAGGKYKLGRFAL